jgi:hypothetical protein
MACLSLTPGAFIERPWMSGNQPTADGTRTVHDSAGSFSVRRSDGDTMPFNRVTGRHLSPIVFGRRYVLVLDEGEAVKYITLVVSIPGRPLRLTSKSIPAGDHGKPIVWVEDAELFGLWQQGFPVTEPLRGLDNLRIDPLTPCGNTPLGSGELSFGVSFFATGDIRIVNAKLEIFNHNDPTQAAIIQILLMASVTRPIAVDAELVIDRSQSMLEPSGSRIKIDTVINAVHLFIELMRPETGDRLGIVNFNDDPYVIQSITEVTEESQDTMIAGTSNCSENGEEFQTSAGLSEQ